MRRLAPLILLIALASACGSVSVHDQAGTATPIAPRRADLSAALLTEAQLRPLAGSVLQTPLTTATITPDPDPRGPCGARVDLPSLHRGALVQYARRRPLLVVLQWVNDLPSGAAARLIAAVTADVHPGCAAYTSSTPYGHPQRNGFVRTFALPPVGDQRVAVETWADLETSRAPRGYGTEIFVRTGNRLCVVTLLALHPEPPALVRAVAGRVAANLPLAGPVASA